MAQFPEVDKLHVLNCIKSLLSFAKLSRGFCSVIKPIILGCSDVNKIIVLKVGVIVTGRSGNCDYR